MGHGLMDISVLSKTNAFFQTININSWCHLHNNTDKMEQIKKPRTNKKITPIFHWTRSFIKNRILTFILFVSHDT